MADSALPDALDGQRATEVRLFRRVEDDQKLHRAIPRHVDRRRPHPDARARCLHPLQADRGRPRIADRPLGPRRLAGSERAQVQRGRTSDQAWIAGGRSQRLSGWGRDMTARRTGGRRGTGPPPGSPRRARLADEAGGLSSAPRSSTRPSGGRPPSACSQLTARRYRSGFRRVKGSSAISARIPQIVPKGRPPVPRDGLEVAADPRIL